MIVFYRLQSKKYEITENSKSYTWNYDSWYHAALEDLQQNEIEEFENLEINEDTKTIIENGWMEASANFQLKGKTYAEAGISCFKSEEEVYNYFFRSQERNNMYFSSDEYYILVFEAQDVFGKGFDGEEIVQYKCTVEKIELDTEKL